MSTRIRLRRDTAANWTSNNPTLTTGEMGYETNTGKFKIGDNSTAWTSLAYSITAELSEGNLNDLKDVTITSAANGDFLRWNGTAWVNDAVNLSTDTVGSFVESLVAGTGITLTNNSGEGATPTVTVDTSVIQARVANVTDTEIGYLDGVTSAIQTQIDLKAPLASPTFTGTVTGVSATMVGLGSVDNTTDANKPVSTATQTALDLKAPLASPTFTGTVTLPDNTVALGTKTTGDYVATITGGTGVASTAATTGEGTTHSLSIGQAVGTTDNVTFAGVTADAIKVGVTAANEIDTVSGDLTIDSAGGTVTVDDNLTVTGNLTVSGTTTSINTETLTVDDNIIVLNNNATGAPSANAGIEIERGSSTNVVLRWNETSDKWELTNDGTTFADIATESYAASLTPATLDAIGDVTITSASSGQFLKWNGSAWINDAVPVINNIDDITGVTITAAADKDFLMYNGTAWVDQAITLGTDTTGSYVASLTAGTGVTLTNNSGEGATPTVAIGQAVGTGDSVTFVGVTAALTGNASTATTLATARNIAGQSFNGSANISIGPTDLTGVTSTAAELNILDGATLTVTELNYVDGVTSAIQTQIDAKQATLVSATSIKTINGSSLLGSGDLTVGAAITTTSITVNTITTIATFDKTTAAAAEFTISIAQGARRLSTKVLVLNDGTTVDFTQYGELSIGTAMPLTLSVDISGSDVRLRATITDAGSTTAVVKVLKTLVE